MEFLGQRVYILQKFNSQISLEKDDINLSFYHTFANSKYQCFRYLKIF